MQALRPIAGVLWLCLLVLPWFLAIVSRSGSSFFAESVGHDLMSKVVSAQEAHGAPPGYYFVLFWVTFWPGATLAAMAVPSIWAARREKGAKFLLCWIVPAWIVLELVITKLPHYVLPLYPAIAILIAGVVDPHVLSRNRWLTRGAAWWFVLPVILGVGTIVVLVTFGRQLGLPAWPFAAAAMIFGLWAWRLYQADGAEHSLLRAMVASILLAIAIYALHHPVARHGVSERGAGAHRARRQLQAGAGRDGGLPGAEPGVPDRNRDRAWSTAPMPPNFCGSAAAGSRWSKRGTSGRSCGAPTRSGCAMRRRSASTATTTPSAARFRLRSIAPRARRERDRTARRAPAGAACRWLRQIESNAQATLATLFAPAARPVAWPG